ncbi:hypothetical protein C2S51_033192 [Perilla frutescens var. frutescens]|nr:hypothetical protein C2S51_033192 [Perilla frutescens var. frutescens]
MNAKIAQPFVHISVVIIFLSFQSFSLESDTISSGLVIKDPDTIISEKQVFKLGFFTPDNSTNRYLGIFYAFSEKTVIWVANRGNPLNDSSGAVTISKDGNLVLINGRNQILWSTNATTSSPPTNTSARILDTGNLRLLRNNVDAAESTIWESFSHPTDVFMRTMKVSHNIYTGEKVFVSSWKNASDPEVGSFSAGLEALPMPQIFIWRNGRPHWRSGPWNGLILIGIQKNYISHLYGSEMSNDSAGNFYYSEPDKKLLMNTRLNFSGSLVRSVWDDQKKSWSMVWWAPENECDVYGRCGPFGSCNSLESPICSCLRGFEALNKDEWESGNWSSGCRRINQLQCDAGGGIRDRFLRLPFMKVPDFAERFYSGQIDECKTRCLNNCSCVAYAHDSNIGCMFWRDSLIDTQKFNGIGVDLYIRLSPSALDSDKGMALHIIIPVVTAFVCVSILVFVAWRWMLKGKGEKRREKQNIEAGQKLSSDSTAIVLTGESEKIDIGELPQFTFEMLTNATDQFHDDNLLGRGGFGPVYKGNLENGKEIAVKRLSAASGQGMQEFMNEVIVISKLQHRNLVRLLGCCVEREEKMLIYEYMANKSLDVCLFDATDHHPSQKVLNWKKRFNIIEGIGRGLLYLHKDSRLKIIHRDLKPSNVLLDDDWNPKISDFGMARIFGGNQDHGDTARVVGTYGYMAPEYAMEGRFSEKSDVYSFGVLMLEIVKGKKNTHFYHREWSLSLLGCAWKLWSEDNCLAFADEGMTSSNMEAEIGRCIQIALLCVQEYPKDRPSIQTVVSMLSNEIVELPAPEQPLFAEKWNGLTTGSTQPQHQVGCSINNLTLTVLEAR